METALTVLLWMAVGVAAAGIAAFMIFVLIIWWEMGKDR